MLQVGKDRRELEEYWQQRVKHAGTVYIHAYAQRMRMAEELHHGITAPADGIFAVAAAKRAEAWALHELHRTTWAYANLVVKGITPPPDEDEKLLI